MKTAYKFRLYPNRQQEVILDVTLETCRHLYNEALAAKKEAWEDDRTDLSYNEMSRQVLANRGHNPYLSSIYAHSLQDVLGRLDKAFKAFYRRVKNGEEPGYPRFKGKGWYKSFTYPDAGTGYKIQGSKLTLSKIGSIRIFAHREVKGKIKTCTIKKDKIGHWFAILTTESDDVPQVESKTALGVDLGLKSLVSSF